jgi:hypothetical protein
MLCATYFIELPAPVPGPSVTWRVLLADEFAAGSTDEERGAGRLIAACQVLTADALFPATRQAQWSARTRFGSWYLSLELPRALDGSRSSGYSTGGELDRARNSTLLGYAAHAVGDDGLAAIEQQSRL